MIEHEWLTEPNLVDFEHAGLKCKIIRQTDWSKHLCGYVQVPKEHPWHGLSYNDITVEVHGGPTFGGCMKDDDNFWFGFDCAHYMDLQPARIERGEHVFYEGCTYKNIAYVTKECQSLAEQIAAANVPLSHSDKEFNVQYKIMNAEYRTDREKAKFIWDSAQTYFKENP